MIPNDNGAICIAPWIHLYIDPNGNVNPCCTAREVVYGNTNNDTLENIYNSNIAKNFRKELLEGKKQKSCTFCYNQEKHLGYSLRTGLTGEYRNFITDKLNVNLDNIKYLDVRSSNLCNMACIMCSPFLSSYWYEDHKEVYGKDSTPQKIIAINKKTQQQILENVCNKNIEKIYFAGGEPLITAFHYEILEHLIDSNIAKKVRLRYNSNLSVLKYKDKNLLDLWDNFQYVQVCPSIDLVGDKAEYQRYGVDWKTIVSNYKEIKKNRPNIEMSPQIAITALSIGYIPELLEFLVKELGFSKGYDQIYPNLAITPRNLNAQYVLNNDLKNVYIKKLNKFKKTKIYCKEFKIIINSCISFLEDTGIEFSQEKYLHMRKYLNKLDDLRSKNWKILWPEIDEIKSKLKHTDEL